MAARGVQLDDAAVWLDPTLRDLLPDPSHLKDMDRAAERIAATIQAGRGVNDTQRDSLTCRRPTMGVGSRP